MLEEKEANGGVGPSAVRLQNLGWSIKYLWIGFVLYVKKLLLCTSVKFGRSVVSDSLWPHELQHARPPWPSPTPSNSCPLSWWYHPTISSSVVPSPPAFSLSWLQSFPMSQFFALGGQSTGASVSVSVLPKNIQDWFPLGLTDFIFLQSKGLSRVFSNTTVQKHQFITLHTINMTYHCWY